MRRAAALALMLGCAAAPPPLTVRVQSTGGGKCAAVIGDAIIELTELQTYLKAHPLPNREVHIAGGGNVPYRCIGAVLYLLQLSGLEKVGFISEPAPQR